MKKITCEMCGSTDLVKKEGLFECQSCGTKYSVEEAKKMMVEGTVKVDNSDYIKNFLEMAENAYDASNLKEAEDYCNKIIENDPKYYKAWFIKGKAAGWQSTLANNRFNESANCFGKAIDYAPEDEKEAISEDGATELKELGLALIRLRAKNFVNYPTQEDINLFLSDRLTILNAISQYILKGGEIPPNYNDQIATIMNNAACDAWNDKITKDFENDDDTGHPGDYAWKKMIEEAGYCITLLKIAIDVDTNDDEEDIQRYKNIIHIHNYCINSCSYTKEFTSYGSYWARSYSLAKEAVNARKKEIDEYSNKIAQIEKEVQERKERERKEKIDKYWEQHKEEKDRLENERKQLLNKKETLEKQTQELPEMQKINDNRKKIEEKQEERKHLGLFKGKEKKQIDSEIELLEVENDRIYSSVKDQVESWKKEIVECAVKINNIVDELTMDR